MKRLLLVAFCAITLGAAHAQTKSKSSSNTGQQTLINELVKNLEADPENPLKVDKKLLMDVANAIPEGSLKSKLLSYSANLGVDENLSMRQIYWDLNTAYSTNANLSKLAPLAKTGMSLDVLLNQTDVLANQINSKVANYQPGVFMNDPSLLTNLQQLTGSESSALVAGFGLELAVSFQKQYEKEKAFKEDYNSYAEMSSQMLYLEVDKRLGNALIDANVGRTPLNMITPLYRYDFDNGASIKVENGVLKFVNEKKNIHKDLISIENRNNGKFYTGIFGSGTTFPQLILVSPSEKNFMIQTGLVEKEKACNNCLSRDEAYAINAETGESDKFRFKNAFRYDYISSTDLTNDSLKLTMWSPLEKALINHNTDIKTGKFKFNRYKPAKEHKFKYPKASSPVVIYANPTSSGYRRYQSFKKGEYLISLLWEMQVEEDGTKSYSSSFLEIGHESDKRFNTNTLLNELTGIAINKENKLFFTTASGGIGAVDLTKLKALETELPDKMRSALTPVNLTSYTHQNNTQALFKTSSDAVYYSHPTLTLTPDEKHLVYIVGNILYIIDVTKLTDPKKFTLTIDPFHLFFAKENGEPTLYLQAFNEFKFPITKKYALNKLISAPKEDKKPAAKAATNAKAQPQAAKKTSSNTSVADEIKKLKALLDDGSITQAEYEQAKKKLLN